MELRRECRFPPAISRSAQRSCRVLQGPLLRLSARNRSCWSIARSWIRRRFSESLGRSPLGVDAMPASNADASHGSSGRVEGNRRRLQAGFPSDRAPANAAPVVCHEHATGHSERDGAARSETARQSRRDTGRGSRENRGAEGALLWRTVAKIVARFQWVVHGSLESTLCPTMPGSRLAEPVVERTGQGETGHILHQR